MAVVETVPGRGGAVERLHAGVLDREREVGGGAGQEGAERKRGRGDGDRRARGGRGRGRGAAAAAAGIAARGNDEGDHAQRDSRREVEQLLPSEIPHCRSIPRRSLLGFKPPPEAARARGVQAEAEWWPSLNDEHADQRRSRAMVEICVDPRSKIRVDPRAWYLPDMVRHQPGN
jgi:hypothetical protein